MLAIHSLTQFLTHSLLLVKIHMGHTKFLWDSHDLVGPTWILTDEKECVKEFDVKIAQTSELPLPQVSQQLYEITTKSWKNICRIFLWQPSSHRNCILPNIKILQNDVLRYQQDQQNGTPSTNYRKISSYCKGAYDDFVTERQYDLQSVVLFFKWMNNESYNCQRAKFFGN
jgi:hypothetical protein